MSDLLAQRMAEAGSLALAQIGTLLADLDSDVAQAMRYTCEGGKGLRAFLVLESARLHEMAAGQAAAAAGAVEALHAYSLVHDDLPCMDDDDLRRGRPTVHRKWDEATAVLTGDALQALSFELLARTDCDPKNLLMLIYTFSQAVGVRGMVGGQAMDVAAETAGTPLSLDQITQLQADKTGALITWAACAGARMAGEEHLPLQNFGAALGLAFQIADDILDVEGDAETVGKAVGKDDARGKATFVSHLGLDGAKRRASELVKTACDALDIYGADADCLRDAARFVISRNS